MLTTDHVVGEIVRNPNDAEGVMREWLADMMTADLDLQTLRAEVSRALAAWDMAYEVTGEEYVDAEQEAANCRDAAHAVRFPDQSALGRDLPAHVAVHLGA